MSVPAANEDAPRGIGAAWPPLAVFAVALAARGVSLALFLRTPYALYPVLDARRAYEAALQILAGEPARGAFLYEPLYPHLQAAIYAASGIDFHHLLVFQAFAGALGAVLAYFVLLEHLPAAWSLLGALLYALFPVTLLSDTLPIKEPLATQLLIASILLLQRHARSGRGQPLLLAGLLYGLVLLVRENLLALAPFLALFLVRLDGGARRGARRAGVFFAGAALAVLPVTARNCLVGKECVLVAASGGSNLYMAFNERSRGDAFVQPAFARSGPARLTEDAIAEASRVAGRPLLPGEASGYWARQALGYAAAHPGRTVKLLAERLWVSLGNDEISGNYPLDYFARVNPLVGFNPLGFGLLLALGAVGWWCARGERLAWVFPAVFLGGWAAFLPFWTLDRFRLPLVLPLAAGAAFAFRESVRLLRARRLADVAKLAAAAAALLAIALPHRVDARRRAEVLALAHARGADLLLQAGERRRAGAELALARGAGAALPEVSLIAARYLAETGRPAEALRELSLFRAWRRDFEDAELLQARLQAELGDADAARRTLREFLAVSPGGERARQALARLAPADEAPRAAPGPRLPP